MENRYKGKSFLEQLKKLNGKLTTELPFPKEKISLNLEDKEVLKALKSLAIEAHYEGYIKREEKSVEKLQKLESWKIPEDFDYDSIPSLRNESRMKLIKVKPKTLAQASRIDGVTPAEIALLQVFLKRNSG
jgi:tRNA uridine 5-carboxymethylaminomethyl modification enzyme